MYSHISQKVTNKLSFLYNYQLTVLIMLTGYMYMNGDVGKTSTGTHFSPPEPLTVSTATNTSYRYIKHILFLGILFKLIFNYLFKAHY